MADNENRTIETNSGMMRTIDVGTYASELDADDMLFNIVEMDGLDNAIDVNTSDFMNEIAKNAGIYYSGQYGFVNLHDFSDRLWSPREYNFDTDQIDFSVTYDGDALIQWLTDNSELVTDHLEQHHTSRDGFISFVKTEWYAFMRAVENNETLEVSVAVNLYLSVEYDDEFEDFYNSVVERMGEWVLDNYFKVPEDSEVIV